MPSAMDRSSSSSFRKTRFALQTTLLSLIPLAGCSEMKGIMRPQTHKLAYDSVPADDPYLANYAKPQKGNTVAQPGLATAGAKPDDALVTLGKPEAIVASRETPIVRSTIHPMSDGRAGSSQPAPGLAIALEAPAVTAPKVEAKPEPKTAVASQPAEVKLDTKAVVTMSKGQLAKLTNYQVRINRQERVGDSLQPPEDVLLSIRRNPMAVRLEWNEGSHKGREVLFSANEPGGMMHVHSGDTLVPVPDLTLSPESPLVMRNSRHPITEAGFDTILQHIERSLSSKDAASKNTYEGIETPEVVGRPCHKLARVNPKNEHWLVYIDKATLYPTLVEARDAKGELLERYIFRDVKPNLSELAANDAFDASLRWKSATGGFLGRIARAASGDAKTTANTVQR